jgi:hypothetical protein
MAAGIVRVHQVVLAGHHDGARESQRLHAPALLAGCDE